MPEYKVDLDESVYSSYKYDDRHGRPVFTVEQGTPFLLKFNIKAWPIPTSSDLFKDGYEVTHSSNRGTIFVGLDKVAIQNVNSRSYAGVYTISSSNTAGTGEFSFQLKVKGTSLLILVCTTCDIQFVFSATRAYTQSVDQSDSSDPSRWC